MKRMNKMNTGATHRPLVMLLLGFVLVTTGCRDLLEDQMPGWLGSSIYDNLNEDGNYNYMARLIEDLDYKEVLAKTGSKTLFVANDSAFEAFFANNPWGVRKYSDLSLPQKKLLLYGAMINNSYQLNTLSSTAGPIIGNCMRRLTALTIYDSVPIIKPEDMPDNPFWAPYKEANKSLVCMMDATEVPMIHFIEKQLQMQKITSSDYNFLMNYTTDHRPGDASINGVPVSGANIKCSNGFVHELAGVMLPLNNMAEVLRNKSTTTLFSHFLERFSIPVYAGMTITNDYNRIYGTNVDSVFQRRYFSKRSQGGVAFSTKPDGKAFDGLLKFDPGWNTYFPATSVTTSEGNAMQQDMAVMLVPSNEAFENYWKAGSGLILKEYYSKNGQITDDSWLDSIPNSVIADLINNNMLNLFQSSVPSKFDLVLNDASNPMGITINDVDSVYLACNGAIYLTNKVFSPTSFVSVLYPAVVDERMKIVKWASDDEVLQYKAYLNSMESRYSFFLPTNDALKNYIDPAAYGRVGLHSNLTYMYRFFYDYNRGTVGASVWTYDLTTKQVVDSIREVTNINEIRNRLKDILDAHTVVGDVEDGNTYYRTKGGTTLKVTNPGTATMQVWGSAQTDKGEGVPVVRIYDQTMVDGNGKTYILEKQPIMTTNLSVYDALMKDSVRFSEFIALLEVSDLLVDKKNKGASNERAIGSSYIVDFLSNFHYTLYVPTNESIQQLYAQGLPTPDEVKALIDSAANDESKLDEALAKQKIVQHFIKYHFQDNSLFVDNNAGDKAINGRYETSMLLGTSFKTLDVQATNNAMTVKGLYGPERHVTNVRNIIAREYQYNVTDVSNPMSSSEIYSTANVVIHQIDGPLMYSADQFK